MSWIHNDCGMELECDSCGDSWDYTQTEVWDIATWEIGNHE